MFSTETTYEVVIFSVGDTKSGTKMGKLQLKSLEDDSILNCILWEETLNRLDPKLFRCGNHLRIVTATYNEKFNNCLVSALELLKEAKTGLDDAQQTKVFGELFGYINKIEDEKMRKFIADYFRAHEAEIKIAPAAKLMHHNYIGGLLIHTLECLKIADVNMELFVQQISRDDVYAACILHDIGKIFEYTVDLETGLIDYDDSFRNEWISHTQYGFSICMEQGFKTVAKMIAAHHGRSDWGAIVDLNQRDLSPEIYLIHHIDDLSAKFGRTTMALLESKDI